MHVHKLVVRLMLLLEGDSHLMMCAMQIEKDRTKKENRRMVRKSEATSPDKMSRDKDSQWDVPEVIEIAQSTSYPLPVISKGDENSKYGKVWESRNHGCKENAICISSDDGKGQEARTIEHRGKNSLSYERRERERNKKEREKHAETKIPTENPKRSQNPVAITSIAAAAVATLPAGRPPLYPYQVQDQQSSAVDHWAQHARSRPCVVSR
jgi:hypothetical protein